MKKQVVYFFGALGTTLCIAALIAAFGSIDAGIAAVIGHEREYPGLPQVLVPGDALTALRTAARVIFPYAQPIYEFIVGLTGYMYML